MYKYIHSIILWIHQVPPWNESIYKKSTNIFFHHLLFHSTKHYRVQTNREKSYENIFFLVSLFGIGQGQTVHIQYICAWFERETLSRVIYRKIDGKINPKSIGIHCKHQHVPRLGIFHSYKCEPGLYMGPNLLIVHKTVYSTSHRHIK